MRIDVNVDERGCVFAEAWSEFADSQRGYDIRKGAESQLFSHPSPHLPSRHRGRCDLRAEKIAIREALPADNQASTTRFSIFLKRIEKPERYRSERHFAERFVNGLSEIKLRIGM